MMFKDRMPLVISIMLMLMGCGGTSKPELGKLEPPTSTKDSFEQIICTVRTEVELRQRIKAADPVQLESEARKRLRLDYDRECLNKVAFVLASLGKAATFAELVDLSTKIIKSEIPISIGALSGVFVGMVILAKRHPRLERKVQIHLLEVATSDKSRDLDLMLDTATPLKIAERYMEAEYVPCAALDALGRMGHVSKAVLDTVKGIVADQSVSFGLVNCAHRAVKRFSTL